MSEANGSVVHHLIGGPHVRRVKMLSGFLAEVEGLVNKWLDMHPKAEDIRFHLTDTAGPGEADWYTVLIEYLEPTKALRDDSPYREALQTIASGPPSWASVNEARMALGMPVIEPEEQYSREQSIRD